MTAILGDTDALVTEIRRRAQQRAVDLEAEAARQVAVIAESCERESAEMRRQMDAAAEAQLKGISLRAAAEGEMQARRHYATVREACIERVWKSAEARLREMVQGPGYVGVLKALAMRASRELGARELELAADPGAHAVLNNARLEEWSAEAGVRFRQAAGPADGWGGLLATAGRTRFNATFPSLLDRTRELLRERVFEALSAGGNA